MAELERQGIKNISSQSHCSHIFIEIKQPLLKGRDLHPFFFLNSHF